MDIYNIIETQDMPALNQWIAEEKLEEHIDGYWTPLHQAAQTNNTAACHALITAGADIEGMLDGGWTPLHEAVQSNNIDVCRILIQAGADINALYEFLGISFMKDTESHSSCHPLSLAIFNEHTDIAKLLIDSGAQTDVDIYTGTALYSCICMATHASQDELVLQLIAAGASLDQTDGNGDTPLSIAIRKANPTTIKYLLDLGASPATPGDWDRDKESSPLILAVELYMESPKQKRLEIVRLLLARGGLTSMEVSRDETLLDLILEADESDLTKLFGLENIQAQSMHQEAELKRRAGPDARTLLPRNHPYFQPPEPQDVLAAIELITPLTSSFQAIAHELDCTQDKLDGWIRGDCRMPYPMWCTLVKLAFSTTSEQPSPMYR